MTETNSRHSDVLVVGGGVIGLACAHYLARSGLSVRIVERDRTGAGASYGNCGLLFFSDLPPLCGPGAIRHELIRTLKGTSPLYIKPRPDLSLAFWLLRFAANCTARHRDAAIRARHAILTVSGELFTDLFAEESLACDADHRGVLMVFSDPAALRAYAHTNRLLEPFGLAAAFLDRRAIHAMEPTLGQRVCGGWHHPQDSHLRPEALIGAWSAAVRKHGVIIEEACPLTQLTTRNGRVMTARTTKGRFTADHYVLAAGAWSPVIGRRLGLKLPVQPGKGYSITMARPAVAPETPCYLYEPNVVLTPWKSGLRIGGTMEFSGFDTRLNDVRLGKLEQAAANYLRMPLDRRAVEEWTGLRPMCVDDLPIIDRVPHLNNLIVATGHGMLGLTTATGTGRLVADMILDRRPAFDPRPFSMGRFVLS